MMLTTKLEAKEPKCNLEVLYDMSHLGESFAPPSLVEDNLAVPDAGLQRVESYVNSQQGVTHEPSQYNSPIEDRGVTGQLDRLSDRPPCRRQCQYREPTTKSCE